MMKVTFVVGRKGNKHVPLYVGRDTDEALAAFNSADASGKFDEIGYCKNAMFGKRRVAPTKIEGAETLSPNDTPKQSAPAEPDAEQEPAPAGASE